jgi:hypothetical protein
VEKAEHGTLIQHDGANDLGSSADFTWFVDFDLVTILLCNQSYGEALLISQVRDKIERIAFGQDVTEPPIVLETVQSALRSFEGNYELPTGGFLILSTEYKALKFTAKGQDAINAIFSGENKPFHYADLNHRAAKLFQATIRDDYSYFKEELEDAGRMRNWRRLIADSLDGEKPDDSAIEIEVIGTLAFPRKKDTMETVIQMRYKKKTVSFGLVWKSDRKLLGMTTEPDGPFMLLMPAAEHMFAGYHLGSAKTIRVSFNVKSGFITGLTVHRKKEHVVARRIENS